MTDQMKKRCDRLFAMGLQFNGQEYCKDDINVHWTEITCDTDQEFETKCQKIEAHLKKCELDRGTCSNQFGLGVMTGCSSPEKCSHQFDMKKEQKEIDKLCDDLKL